MRVTAVQAENIKALGGLNGALLISLFSLLSPPMFMHAESIQADLYDRGVQIDGGRQSTGG